MSDGTNENWLEANYSKFSSALEIGDSQEAEGCIAEAREYGFDTHADRLQAELESHSRKSPIVAGVIKSRGIYWRRMVGDTSLWSASTRCLVCCSWWLWGVKDNLK